MAPARVGMGGLRSGSVGVADLRRAEWRIDAEHGRPVGHPPGGCSRGFAFEQLGIEEADLVAEPSGRREHVGEDQPAGDPPIFVAIVNEDRSGQVGAAESVIEPTGDESGDGVGGGRVAARRAPEDDPGGFGQPPGRGVEPVVGVGLCRLVSPEADDGDLEERQECLGIGRDFLGPVRDQGEAKASTDPTGDPSDRLGVRLLVPIDLIRRSRAPTDRLRSHVEREARSAGDS